MGTLAVSRRRRCPEQPVVAENHSMDQSGSVWMVLNFKILSHTLWNNLFEIIHENGTPDTNTQKIAYTWN